MTVSRLEEIDRIINSCEDAAAVEKEMRKELQAEPANTFALLRLARCQLKAGRWFQSTSTYEIAVNLSGDVNVRIEYGLVLASGGAYLAAIAQHQVALAMDPNNWSAKFALAQAQHQLCLIDEAISGYDEILKVNPDMVEATSFRLVALNYRTDDQRFLKAAHARYGALAGKPRILKNRGVIASYLAPQAKLRVGMLSPDFRQHSCAYFIEPLIADLPKDVDVVLYHDSHHKDEVTTRMAGMAGGRLRHTTNLSNDALEKLMLDDELDVAVDLAGHFGRNRLQVFAKRVAPAQAAYLGYPNTTGVDAMDFRIADQTADWDANSDFTEKLVFSGSSMWRYLPPLSVWTPGPSGVPVIGYFGMLSKLTFDTLVVWAEIMAKTPSTLLVKGGALEDTGVERVWRKKMTLAGIPNDRLKIVGRTPDLESHLQMYGQVTLALDTFPYSGTTGTCEALWMGVPVVTKVGSRHASRTSYSLLTGVGEESCCCLTDAHYVKRAVELLEHPRRIRRERVSSANWIATKESVASFWETIRSISKGTP